MVLLGLACGVRLKDCRQGDAEVADLVAVDFEDGDVDDDFGTGAVEVVDQLLREQELVGGGAHDDGVLAGDEVDLDAGIEQVAEGGDDLVGVVLLGRRW